MRFRIIAILVTAALLVLCLTTLIVGSNALIQIPPVQNQMIPGSTRVHVQLSAQNSPTGWPANSFIPITARAMGGGTISSIELYINNQLYETISTPAGWNLPDYAYQWNWQPGTDGLFVLFAKAYNTDGASGVSDPVMLTVKARSAVQISYRSQEGDSLEVISATNGIDLQTLAASNPQIPDPNQVLPVDTTVHIPDPIVESPGSKIIPGFPRVEGVYQPQEILPTAVDEDGGQGGINLPSWQDINFWWQKQTGSESDKLPVEPIIFPSYTGCNVKLNFNYPTFMDSSDPAVDKTRNEDGFFLYKSQDGSAFSRIATLPPVTSSISWKYQYGYDLADQSGIVSFTVSAFNLAGETISTPVTIDLNTVGCKNPERGLGSANGIGLENGDLILPYAMDLAYVYLSVDGSSAVRIPEDHRMFQPMSGVKLNIFDYLTEKMSSFTAADFSLKMEVWGWIGSELKFVGIYEDTVHRSLLLVCSQEGEGMCINGVGQWVTEINFSDIKPVNEQIFEFKWITTSLSEADEVCIQAAAKPFPGENFWNMGPEPISSGCYYYDGKDYVKGSEGTFTEHMQYLLFTAVPADELGWGAGSQVDSFGSNWFASQVSPDSAFTIYFRVLPRMEEKGQTRFSNTVALHHDTAPLPSDLPPLASPYNSIYHIEILRDTYTPPLFEVDEKWGCVIVDEDPTGHFTPGQEVCPPPFGTMAKMDDCGSWDAWCLLKGVYKTFTEVYDSILFWYDWYKYTLSSIIAETIPWCGGNEKCIGVIKTVMEKAIQAYTGIPENPPKSDDLIADNLADLIVNSAIEVEKYETESEYSLVEAGCEIAKCKEKLAKAIKQQLKTQRSVAAQPACIDSYQAYFHAKDAICLDPSIIVHAAPGGSNKAGMVAIKITRKVNIESTGVQATDQDKYLIHVTVDGENGDLNGQLFPPAEVLVPWLAPGESAIIAVQFPIIGGEINEPLYFGGISHMKAVEACYSPESSVDWVPCMEGGSDSWDFRNPADKLSDQVGQP